MTRNKKRSFKGRRRRPYAPFWPPTDLVGPCREESVHSAAKLLLQVFDESLNAKGLVNAFKRPVKGLSKAFKRSCKDPLGACKGLLKAF